MKFLPTFVFFSRRGAGDKGVSPAAIQCRKGVVDTALPEDACCGLDVPTEPELFSGDSKLSQVRRETGFFLQF